MSDALGVASTQWSLGTTSGSQSLAIRGGEQAVTVQAEAAPGPPAALALASGGGQSGPVGQDLTAPVAVKVEDEFGNGVPLVSVSLAVSQGEGSVSPEEAISDEAGLVTATWTMGTATGPNTLAVSADPLASIEVTAAATPGPPAQISLVSGDGQSGEVGLALSSPIVVELRDQFDNLAAGGSATFEGDGSADPTPATADGSGQASATWSLGTSSGPQSMEASVGDQSVTFSAVANPGPPSAMNVTRGNDQRGFAGVELPDRPTVMVADSFGNGVPEIDVGFQVTGGGGSVGSASERTDPAGIASTLWTLGTDIGDNAMEALVEGIDTVQFTATATSGPPASIAKVSGDGQSVEVGTLLPEPLVFRVEDLFGNLVERAVLQAVVVSGGGAPDPAAPTTDSAGLAEVRWALGGSAGTQVLEIRVGSVTPVSFTAVGQPGPPTSMTKAAGDGQTSAVGAQVPVRPAVRVSDSFGNSVAGVDVSFDVVAGGGSISGASQTTGGDGHATVGSWTLGPGTGENLLAASSNGLGGLTFTATGQIPSYDIDLRYVGAPPTTSQQNAFNQAADRWESVITGELSNYLLVVPSGWCAGLPHPALNETIDDLLIFIEVTTIDGTGGVLGQAGPCGTRPSGGQPALGFMKLDVADLNGLEASGDLGTVILHEIGHVVGIGTNLWYGVLVGSGTADPYFPGPTAVASYYAASGTAANAVPVANTGGSGSRDVHWRESDMDRELMTPFVDLGAVNPLSVITVGALQDLGYSVDFGAADGYIVGPALRQGRENNKLLLKEIPAPPPKPAPTGTPGR